MTNCASANSFLSINRFPQTVSCYGCYFYQGVHTNFVIFMYVIQTLQYYDK